MLLVNTGIWFSGLSKSNEASKGIMMFLVHATKLKARKYRKRFLAALLEISPAHPPFFQQRFGERLLWGLIKKE